jgi:diguanylate cyclase (GGDEF)-like protein
MKIRTQIFCSFTLMLVLLAAVAAVAIDRTAQIGRLAGDLNRRVVDKTRIAANIVDLGQQIRFIDSFVLRADTAPEDELSRNLIESRTRAVTAQISSYARLSDTVLEAGLLQNLRRYLDAYLALQQEILTAPAADRLGRIEDDESRLAAAFAQVARQSKGLSLMAETQARAARTEATAVEQAARTMVLIVAGLALAMGVIILGVLLVRVFRPLARITEALVALSNGQLDVALRVSDHGEIGRMVRALNIFRDHAVALRQANEDIKAAHSRADALARHDALTGLPNRRVLAASVEEAIADSAGRGLAAAVLVIDLDRFKPVNDFYGHGAGDQVLCEIATRIGASIRAGDVAGRLGGDEFAVVLEFEPGSDAPQRAAKRILAAIEMPMTVNGTRVAVGASIGVALWPADGTNAESLLHAADLAMLKAKRDGRDTFRFFEPDMDVQLRARASLEARINRAIHEGDVRPHYQPLVDLRTGAIVGFEVLARWHDGDTIRPPGEFIPIADEAGLIPELTYAVLRQACRDAAAWPTSLTLALNVTPAQIADARLPDVLLGLLQEEGFAPSRLELEVTENALIGDIESAKNVMSVLRTAGVRISLDDFGTGYSSLHHLRDLKFDKIKIDRSFVQSMLVNAEATKIVETILALGRSLDIRIIAEGIEDREHLLTLQAQGCEYGQGYHFGKPLAAANTGELLARQLLEPGLTQAA